MLLLMMLLLLLLLLVLVVEGSASKAGRVGSGGGRLVRLESVLFLANANRSTKSRRRSRSSNVPCSSFNQSMLNNQNEEKGQSKSGGGHIRGVW
jgi:hypothetical protein